MSYLDSQKLCLIYQYLTNQEIVVASLVCRSWNWMLWRKTEQSQLWVPRIFRHLLKNPSECVIRLNKVLFESSMHHILSVDNPIQTIHEVTRKAQELAAEQAHGYWLCDSLYDVFKDMKISQRVMNMRKRYYYIFDEKDKTKGAAYYVGTHSNNPLELEYTVSCMSGRWKMSENGMKQMESGSLISDGRLCYVGSWDNNLPHGYGTKYSMNGPHDYVQYEGDFRQGNPDGQGALYRPDCTLVYRGDWTATNFDGNGIEYALDGKTITYQGQFLEGIRVNGMWYNDKRELIYSGDFSGLNLLMKKQYEEHKCTFELTGSTFVYQEWYYCDTCFPDSDNSGICVSCAGNCHKDHRLRKNSGTSNGFFCDCDREICKAQNGCLDDAECECIDPSNNENDISIQINLDDLDQQMLGQLLEQIGMGDGVNIEQYIYPLRYFFAPIDESDED